jgi:hypothetical protein
MAQGHPITPPPELLDKWAVEYWGDPDVSIGGGEKYIAIQAAQWGADQELEACCEWLDKEIGATDPCDLRAARRPKSPSLKQQALEILDDVDAQLGAVHYNILRRALEELPDD